MGKREGQNRVLQWAIALGLMLSLTACGGNNAGATPTLDLEAIPTFAFETFQAQQATQLALTPPTDTPAPTPLPTLPLLLPSPLPVPTFSFTTPTLASGGTSGCDAAYVADVTIPDKTRMDPNHKFTKTWLLLNSGTCQWSTSFKLSYVDGLAMGGKDAYVPIPVPPGTQIKLSVDMTAPDSPGDYYGRWAMQNEAGQRFGSFVSVVIKVNAPEEPTETPTP